MTVDSSLTLLQIAILGRVSKMRGFNKYPPQYPNPDVSVASNDHPARRTMKSSQ
ncbi:Hypothetical protein FKW44_017757 [Caligus rogercresseyi]|uniref:Uncharacterized protein n=1 Tax=Caligus rogercresseyi TaxID=217165 RepID=A0A7T8JWB5_CALRO|nr:Hypothetical protein FKW44_017757 [Caligus rogercresseyi]